MITLLYQILVELVYLISSWSVTTFNMIFCWSFFLTGTRFHVSKCDWWYFASIAWLILKECYSVLSTVHKAWLFLFSSKPFSQFNNFDVYWLKLFISFFTFILTGIKYFQIFLNLKYTSANFPCRQVTYDLIGRSSYLLQKKYDMSKVQ